MKKILVILLAMIMIMSLSSMAFATEQNNKQIREKTVDVSITISSEQEFEVIYIGDEVELKAITPKHGSSVVDYWMILDENGIEVTDEDTAKVTSARILTLVDDVNSYISTATFVSDEAGKFTLKYNIEMSAGKSHVQFIGEEASEELVVVEKNEEIILSGAEIRNIVWTGSGPIKGDGKIYAIYSDGSAVDTTMEASVTFGNGEIKSGLMTKEVTVVLNGVQYSVQVTRP